MVLAGGVFQKTALISISRLNGSEVTFAAKTEEISFSGADQDIDIITLINGGNLTKLSPMTPLETTLTLYPTEISTAAQLFYGDDSDVTQPLKVINKLNRYKHRIVVLWVDDLAQSTAVAATADGKAAYRIIATDGYMTVHEHTYEDMTKGVTVTLKFPPFDQNANGRIREDSTNGEATKVLPVVPAYTAAYNISA